MNAMLYGARARKFSIHGQLSEELLFLQELTREETMNAKETTRSEVAHDIKNALSGIRTCAEVLSYEDMEPEERVSFATTIITELDRLMLLSQELLSVSSARAETLNLVEFSLKEIVEQLLSVVRCDFQNRQIEIVSQLVDPGNCKIDVAKMQRALMNIISNARDAMSEGGQLNVFLRKKGQQLQLEFSDSGCGMSPELQARFLEPYVSEGKPHGTGLGMAIVKKVLDRHGAALEVESHPGKGTAIRILLPCS